MFLKNWNCTSHNFSLLKNSQGKGIPNWARKPVWLLINNTNKKNSHRKSAGRCFLKPFFIYFLRIGENFFQRFHTKFSSLLYMISLAYISHCLSGHHNPELWCVICTGVTLLARLSANQNRVIFSCVLSGAETLVCG